MSNVSVKRATPEDIRWVAEHLRDEDYIEVHIATGRKPREVVRESAVLSLECLSARLKGEEQPCVLFGVAADPTNPQSGVVWMLCTEGIQKAPKAVLKASRVWLCALLGHYDLLWNRAWSGNALHIRWLEHLGATLAPPVVINGERFVPFQFTKEAAHV